MENEPLSARESLLVIQSMIDKTKTQLGHNTIYFLVWGWLVFFACLLQYFLLVIVQYRQHHYAWLLMIIGAIFSILYSVRSSRTQKVRTYAGQSMAALWTGLGISFFTLFLILLQAGWEYGFPLYILLYATGTFISGGILQFRPLQIGGAICWAIAVSAAYVSYQNQILLTAAAILVSYLIPAYLLKYSTVKS